MKWGVVECECEYKLNGEPCAAARVTLESVKFDSIDEITANVEVKAVKWSVCHEVNGELITESRETFGAFMELLSGRALRYVFTWKGAQFLHQLDVERLWNYPGRWEVITNERDEHGFYKGRNKEAYMERSADNGVRYSSTLWTRAGIIGGNRHKRIRPTTFVNLDGLICCGYVDACKAFNIPNEGTDMERTFKAVKAFDEVCRAHNLSFMEEKKLTTETIGGIAKQALLQHVGKLRCKTACPLTPEQYDYLFKGRLLRGGCNVLNTYQKDYRKRQPVLHCYGYDVNSEFLAVAANMYELTGLTRSSWEEYQKDDTLKYTYIIIFSELFCELKDGAVPVIKDGDGEPYEGGAYTMWNGRAAFFAEEVEELQHFYTFQSFKVEAVLKSFRRVNPGYEEFAREWYDVKKEATKQGDHGTRFLAKMVINSALGKLLQKMVYNKVEHVEYKSFPGMVHAATTRATEEEQATECGALAYVQGAYVLALARVYWLTFLRAVTDGKPLDEVFLYGDVDSFYLTQPAPEYMTGEELGMLKVECNDGVARFLGLKCYAYADRDGRSACHIVGTPLADYVQKVRNELDRTPRPEDLVYFLDYDLTVDTTANIIVPGGRVDIRIRREITKSLSEYAEEGHVFGRGKFSLYEL